MTTFIIYLSVYMHLQEYSRASERGKGEHSSLFIGQLSSLQDGISARASRGDQGIIYLYGLRIYISFRSLPDIILRQTLTYIQCIVSSYEPSPYYYNTVPDMAKSTTAGFTALLLVIGGPFSQHRT